MRAQKLEAFLIIGHSNCLKHELCAGPRSKILDIIVVVAVAAVVVVVCPIEILGNESK